MKSAARRLPVEARIRLVEDLWDSIAADQHNVRLTATQRAEIDRRLDAYERDGNRGRLALDALAELRAKL